MKLMKKKTVRTFQFKGASAVFIEWENDNIAAIEDFFSKNRGKGEGSELLKIVCKYADDNKLNLLLEASPDDEENALNLDQLINLYQKFGFEVVPDGKTPPMMIRNINKFGVGYRI